MSLTDEPPVNGHNGHSLPHLAPFQPVPIRSTLDPVTPATTEQMTPEPSPPLAGPDSTTEQPEQRPVAPPPAAAPTPVPPAPRAEEPPLPAKPVQPEFPLRTLQAVGLVMAVAMSAVGQVLFWRGFFGGGAEALLGAIAIAAAFEVLMIGATDMSLHHKTAGSPWWLLLFPIGASAAGVAAIVQLLHWPPEMGIPFAAASTLGWAAHAVSGWMRAQHYRTAIAEYNAEVDRWRRKAESRADAEYERARAEVDTARQAAQRAVDTVTPTPESKTPAQSTAPATVNGSRKTGKGTASRPVSTRATKAIAMEVGARHGVSTPSTLKQALTGEGYSLPTSPTTVENWCRDLRQTGADGQ